MAGFPTIVRGDTPCVARTSVPLESTAFGELKGAPLSVAVHVRAMRFLRSFVDVGQSVRDDATRQIEVALRSEIVGELRPLRSRVDLTVRGM